MSRKLILLFIALNCFLYGFSQSTTFIETYSKVFVYVEKDKTSTWYDQRNVFTFNYNETSDIKHYDSKGEATYYTAVGGITKGKAVGGEKYQEITCLTNDGAEITFLYFEENATLRVVYKGYGYFEYHK
jgi:hypothetical protein